MSNPDLSNWQPRPIPQRQPLAGCFVRLEPLAPGQHGDELWLALQGPSCDPTLWDYLGFGPFAGREAFDAWLADIAQSPDPLFFSVIDLASGRALGLLSYLRITAQDGCIEIGNITFGQTMQRTPSATEAVWLLARHAFDDLGYRRLEWKCDARNTRSRRAAERLGFVHEGLFRQHRVVKGQNRDTAWFAILDGEWPARREAFERWLAADNFDAEGRQKRRLEDLREG